MTEVIPRPIASIRAMPRGRRVDAPAWAGRASTWAVVGVAALAVVLLGAWLWPGPMRDGERLEVLVVGDGAVDGARDTIERQVRGAGRSAQVAATVATPCDAVPVLEAAEADVVVLSFLRAGGGCGSGDTNAAWLEAVEAAGDARVVLLVQPGPAPVGQDPEVRDAIARLEGRRDLLVADPSTLLGEREGSPARLPCQWWDDCERDGFRTVRSADGTLNDAGGQRLARVLVGALP